jgi:hypothetical protein
MTQEMTERYKWGGKVATVRSAQGMKGYLFESLGDVIFRVTSPDGSFMNDKLIHSDMEITINDELASFCEFEGEEEGILACKEFRQPEA